MHAGKEIFPHLRKETQIARHGVVIAAGPYVLLCGKSTKRKGIADKVPGLIGIVTNNLNYRELKAAGTVSTLSNRLPHI